MDKSIHDLNSLNSTFAIKFRNIMLKAPKHQPLHINILYILCGSILLLILIIFTAFYKKLNDKKKLLLTSEGVKVKKQLEDKAIQDCRM